MTIVRPACAADAAAIARIYSHYVLTTVISFEEQAVPADEMVARMREVQAAGLRWLVAESAGEILGYAYAGKWKARSGYRFSVESSVYVAPEHLSAGLGTRLYETLIAELRSLGLHTVIGGIALPNDASVRLHERFGFVQCAHFRETGFKFGRWIDVGYWQLHLDPTARA